MRSRIQRFITTLPQALVDQIIDISCAISYETNSNHDFSLLDRIKASSPYSRSLYLFMLFILLLFYSFIYFVYFSRVFSLFWVGGVKYVFGKLYRNWILMIMNNYIEGSSLYWRRCFLLNRCSTNDAQIRIR